MLLRRLGTVVVDITSENIYIALRSFARSKYSHNIYIALRSFARENWEAH